MDYDTKLPGKLSDGGSMASISCLRTPHRPFISAGHQVCGILLLQPELMTACEEHILLCLVISVLVT